MAVHDAGTEQAEVADEGSEEADRDDPAHPEDVRERDHLAAVRIGGRLRDHRQRDGQVGARGEAQQQQAGVEPFRARREDHEGGAHDVQRQRRHEDRFAAEAVARGAADERADADRYREDRRQDPVLQVIDAETLAEDDERGARRDDGPGVEVRDHAGQDRDVPGVRCARGRTRHPFSFER